MGIKKYFSNPSNELLNSEKGNDTKFVREALYKSVNKLSNAQNMAAITMNETNDTNLVSRMKQLDKRRKTNQLQQILTNKLNTAKKNISTNKNFENDNKTKKASKKD